MTSHGSFVPAPATASSMIKLAFSRTVVLMLTEGTPFCLMVLFKGWLKVSGTSSMLMMWSGSIFSVKNAWNTDSFSSEALALLSLHECSG
ncbi:hypothetical protein DPMN_090223 [Dreissena polymorpha]|uniref:Uncharacterized protein n=1 Tax=Dreissena polymorpha TaxID=45954 RepID=A0A9D4QYU4_DREPO|nr:hypothetical protein DPMN_090223 [Dreissena polymorpha]